MSDQLQRMANRVVELEAKVQELQLLTVQRYNEGIDVGAKDTALQAYELGRRAAARDIEDRRAGRSTRRGGVAENRIRVAALDDAARIAHDGNQEPT